MSIIEQVESKKRLHEVLGVRVFTPPPKGFHPHKASERELIVHGFPVLPAGAHPKVQEKWKKVLSRSMEWVEPQFALRTDRTHKPRVKVENDTSRNWSGSVAFAAAQDRVTWVAGQWTVPHVVPVGSGNVYCAAWVGIDGDGSSDVLQAGTECDVENGVHQSYLWWEWFPDYEVQIPNIAVVPGDVIYCLICATSDTEASFYLTNQTTRQYTSFSKTAPGTTKLRGNCAEWIVEAPTVGGGQSALAEYGMVYFDQGIAGTKNAALLGPGKGTPITMVNAAGKAISTMEVESDELIECAYQI